MTRPCRLLVAGVSSFDFGGQRELDQAANGFRARHIVPRGKLINSGEGLGRQPARDIASVPTALWTATQFFVYIFFFSRHGFSCM